MTEGQPAAGCWLGGAAPVAFQADTPRGVRSVPRPAGIDAGASPRSGRQGTHTRIPTSPRGSYGAPYFRLRMGIRPKCNASQIGTAKTAIAVSRSHIHDQACACIG